MRVYVCALVRTIRGDGRQEVFLHIFFLPFFEVVLFVGLSFFQVVGLSLWTAKNERTSASRPVLSRMYTQVRVCGIAVFVLWSVFFLCGVLVVGIQRSMFLSDPVPMLSSLCSSGIEGEALRLPIA